VPLRELAAVVAVNARHVGINRQLRAERRQHLDLLRRVRDVVVATDDVRDPVEPVLEGRREVVRRTAVRADEHEVLELHVREVDPALDRVVPAGDPVVGHANPDRALVLVRSPFLH
jgi:hypothetical protein